MATYDDAFFRNRSGSRRSADVVVPLVLDLTQPSSVVDVGCGTGSWLAVFNEHGVEDVLGVDGDYVPRDTLEIPVSSFEPRDLTQPFSLERRFDLAVSLEVAEHLPKSAAQGFVASLTALSDVVLFSAAVPGQYGQHHVNEQWQDWWADLFAKRDYVPIDCIRPLIWEDDRVEFWYAQNTLVYVRRSELERRARLRDQYERGGLKELRVVHPRRLQLWPHRALFDRLRALLRR